MWVCVLWCFVIHPLSPAYSQEIINLGGELSTSIPGHNAIQVAAPNVTDNERRLKQINGFTVFHRLTRREDGLGPRFVSNSCGSCHVQNGKGPIRLGGGRSTMVVKVSRPGLAPDGSPRPVPGIGEQLQDTSISGRRHFDLRLRWREIGGRYPDGTRYKLRAPDLRFRIPGESFRRVRASLRMTPPLVGLGLLESIPESTILGFSDPADSDGDGISGKPQYVTSLETGERVLGRFGFRASHPNVKEQSGVAAFLDMGLTNEYFPGPGGTKELSDDELSRVTIYQQLPGVPRARNQDDPQVQLGKALFQQINCQACHKMNLQTGSSAEYPELANQVIHPFTDLLLHDMGPGLADRRPEFNASGREWRTTPLWGLGFVRTVSGVRQGYLHDGRARTVEEAILWHGGEAKASKEAFKNLSKAERSALIKFLMSL